MQFSITVEIEQPFHIRIDSVDTEKTNRTCPYCGQSKIPFKMGVCICGRQVGNIQYVYNTERYAKEYYSYIGNKKK